MPSAPIPSLKPLPIDGCRNLKPSGLFTVPSGPLAGTILPLYEMIDLTPKTETTNTEEKEERQADG